MAFVFNYIWMEVLVTIIEASVYSVVLRKHSTESDGKWLESLYAVTANAVSFGIGLYIAHLIPGIF